MNAHTRMSEKGQVVVPKAVRDRLGWTAGDELDVIEAAGGVLLTRRNVRKETLSVEQAVERLGNIYTSRGSPVPLEDLSWSPGEAGIE